MPSATSPKSFSLRLRPVVDVQTLMIRVHDGLVQPDSPWRDTLLPRPAGLFNPDPKYSRCLLSNAKATLAADVVGLTMIAGPCTRPDGDVSLVELTFTHLAADGQTQLATMWGEPAAEGIVIQTLASIHDQLASLWRANPVWQMGIGDWRVPDFRQLFLERYGKIG